MLLIIPAHTVITIIMKYISIILFLLPFSSLLAQDDADTLFKRGSEAYATGEFDRAAALFREIVEKYPEYRLYSEACYNTAYSYDEAKNADSALAWYNRIIASGMRDDEKTEMKGIFEDHTNFKHMASLNAGTIEYNRKNYQKALQYYQDCLTRFPYYNASGTDQRISRNMLVIYIADCFDMMERYEEALTTLIPAALDSEGSSNYAMVITRTIRLIDKHFERKQLISELEASFSTIQPKKDGNGFDLIFHEQHLDLMPYIFEKEAVEEFPEELRKSKFWNTLNS